MATQKPRPMEVTVSSSIKHFGLDAGVSTESVVGVKFEVPGSMSAAHLQEFVREQKYELDCLTLAMELDRGAISKRVYNKKLRMLEDAYKEEADDDE